MRLALALLLSGCLLDLRPKQASVSCSDNVHCPIGAHCVGEVGLCFLDQAYTVTLTARAPIVASPSVVRPTQTVSFQLSLSDRAVSVPTLSADTALAVEVTPNAPGQSEYRFTLTVPDTTPSGDYRLTVSAMSETANRSLFDAGLLSVDADPPALLRPRWLSRQRVTGGDVLELEAATSADARVESVTLHDADDRLLAAFSASLDVLPDGQRRVHALLPLEQVFTQSTTATLVARVRVVDELGNGAEQASDVIQIDSTAPVAFLTQQPSESTAATDAAFAFAADDVDASFACSLDGAEFAPCRSPFVARNLLAGPHELRLLASDALGNKQLVATRATWTVERKWLRIDAAAQQRSCGIATDGSLHCFGATPRRIAHARPVVSSATTTTNNAGSSAINDVSLDCFIDDALAAYCVGYSGTGLMGSGPVNATLLVPTRVALTGAVLSLALADDHACAVVQAGGDRRLACWGAIHGHIGAVTTPLLLADGVAQRAWQTVALAHGYSCALNGDGPVHDLYCWGENTLGQIGNGLVPGAGQFYDTPVALVGARYRHVATAKDHACAVREDGALACWGSNTFGQSGDAPSPTINAPRIVGAEVDWVAVSAGHLSTCGVRAAGGLNRIYCFGDNRYGQLGNGDTLLAGPAAAPTLAPDGAVSIVAGDYHYCATYPDGSVVCWGLNGGGTLGRGDAARLVGDGAIVLPGQGYSAVSAGEAFSCAVREGDVVCWGGNPSSLAGDDGNSAGLGRGIVPNSPDVAYLGATASPAPPTNNFSGYVGVSAGASACGVRVMGGQMRLFCWGTNYGALPLPTIDPTEIAPAASGYQWDVPSVGVGGFSMCALAHSPDNSEHRLYCMGDNSQGVLGYGGSPPDAHTPPPEVGAGAGTSWTDWQSVSIGVRTSCGIRAGGALYCWGSNASGHRASCPDDSPSIDLPAAVSGPTGWLEVAVGEFGACGIRSDAGVRHLYCWGVMPDRPLSGSDCVLRQMDGDGWHGLTVMRSNWCLIGPPQQTAYCFGENGFHQAAANEHVVARDVVSQPTPVSGDSDWLSVSAGRWHSCGVRDDSGKNTLWCWGSGLLGGNLGNGSAFSAVPMPAVQP